MSDILTDHHSIDELRFIAGQFADSVIGITPLGNGLINDTFLVTTDSSPMVLQRINRSVFPKPESIIDNLAVLTRHVQHNKHHSDSTHLRLPDLLKTRIGDTHVCDRQGNVWRALSYIGHTESLETIRFRGDAVETGLALGRFHRLCSGIDPGSLHDTLPGFHETPLYLRRYQQILSQISLLPQTPDDRFCADFIADRVSMADDLEAAKRLGLLRLGVIHGDPKLNNFLFDTISGRIGSLIDLDTVKPGLLHYDIGDCLRSCCHVPETDEFDTGTAEAILEGYLGEAADFFTDADYRYLYPAMRLIPYELGLRFYTDHLEGDRYFKVTGPGQNLQRAVGQFRLCASIIRQEQELTALIEGLRRKC